MQRKGAFYPIGIRFPAQPPIEKNVKFRIVKKYIFFFRQEVRSLLIMIDKRKAT